MKERGSKTSPSIMKFVRRRLPNASEAELVAAAESVRQFLMAMLQLHHRLEQDETASDSPKIENRDRFKSGGAPPTL
jgi:hypothetical protein